MKVLKALAKPFTALAGKVDHAVEQKILMTVARKLAMVLAAYLVHQGVIDASEAETLAGLLVGLVSLFSGVQNALNHG